MRAERKQHSGRLTGRMGKGAVRMGEKSLQKKKHILETARKVFIEKGYKRVTMKDIVEACGISRGGLYLYFNNTGEIFLEIMKMENQESGGLLPADIPEEATAAEILAMFLEGRKEEILRREDALTQAVYEFYFENNLPKKEDLLKWRFDASVRIIEALISTGVENGELSCGDCEGRARSIMYTMEGLKISAQTIGVTSDMVDREISYILGSLELTEE